MKPRVLTKCVANTHAGRDERIVEFSFPGAPGLPGGLIAFRLRADGTPVVDVYALSAGVEVNVAEHRGA